MTNALSKIHALQADGDDPDVGGPIFCGDDPDVGGPIACGDDPDVG